MSTYQDSAHKGRIALFMACAERPSGSLGGTGGTADGTPPVARASWFLRFYRTLNRIERLHKFITFFKPNPEHF
jgi:hypothetical protein